MSRKKQRNERLFRDPGEAETYDPYPTKREQDERYQRALLRAIERGDEHAATSPSTAFGTRAPLVNYRRDET